MLRKNSNYLPLIIALALALRLVGITHGFPFIFHPDEPTIVRSALAIRFNLNPGHFDWPHLYIYLNYLLYMLFDNLRKLVTFAGYKEYTYFSLPLFWDDELVFYFITRSFSAILGALTVVPVYLTAKKIFGRRAGWLSALAWAVIPFHVWHSHYSLPDVPMTFFLSWALYFISGLIFRKKMSDYLWAGFFIGLAASTKYNGALMIGGLLLAHFIRVLSERNEKLLDFDSWKCLFLSGFMSIVGFILGTPYAVLDHNTFIRADNASGALWQFTNVGKVSLLEHLKQFFTVMAVDLPENMGYTFVIIFIAAFLYVIFRAVKHKKFFQDKDLLFFTLLGLGLIFYVAGSEKTRAHYFFVAYPAVILGGVGFLAQRLENIKSRVKNIIWIIVFSFPLYFSILSAYSFYQTDTRVIFYRWMLDNKRAINKVYVLDNDLAPIFEKLNMKVQYEDASFRNFEPGAYVVDTGNENKVDIKEILQIKGPLNRGPEIDIYAP